METYYEYVKKAFEVIVATSFEDESLTILKEMENKNFYFARLQ